MQIQSQPAARQESLAQRPPLFDSIRSDPGYPQKHTAHTCNFAHFADKRQTTSLTPFNPVDR